MAACTPLEQALAPRLPRHLKPAHSASAEQCALTAHPFEPILTELSQVPRTASICLPLQALPPEHVKCNELLTNLDLVSLLLGQLETADRTYTLPTITKNLCTT